MTPPSRQTLAGTVGSPNGSADNILFGVLHNGYGFLGFLQALRDESVVKSLAEPTLTTMSGRPASFLVGGEQAIPVPAGLGQVGVQFEEFGTRLELPAHRPGQRQDPPGGRAGGQLARTRPTARSISGTVVPGRDTDRVNTTVELEDGQTFVIGGLIQHTVTGTTDKMPILGDLPFLGTPSAASRYKETETELVILVTPHLVDAEDCCAGRRKFFLARKPAAPTILSYSWKESSKRRAARAKSSRTITTCRPTRTAPRRTCSRAPASGRVRRRRLCRPACGGGDPVGCEPARRRSPTAPAMPAAAIDLTPLPSADAGLPPVPADAAPPAPAAAPDWPRRPAPVPAGQPDGDPATRPGRRRGRVAGLAVSTAETAAAHERKQD